VWKVWVANGSFAVEGPTPEAVVELLRAKIASVREGAHDGVPGDERAIGAVSP
jgi:hypothetical protein